MLRIGKVESIGLQIRIDPKKEFENLVLGVKVSHYSAAEKKQSPKWQVPSNQKYHRGRN